MKTLLLGDVCPTEYTAPLFDKGDIKTLFNDVASLFEGNDVNLINLECAITESENRIEKFGPNLKAPLGTAATLKALGVTHAGLSNNHIFDFGREGARDTVSALDRVGIAYTGFGENYDDSRKNLVIEKNGEKITFITVCEHEYSYALPDRMGARPFDVFDTIEDIRDAKATSDRVIVTYHGGKEQCEYPSPRLLKVCHAMARAGADVILCQHSHCIGCYELYQNTHILYGQGNFHFVKPTDAYGWHTALAVKYDSLTHKIEFIAHENTDYGVKLSDNPEIMAGFNARSRSLLDGSWKNGWHEFCLSKEESYKNAIHNASEKPKKFGHYLDCEAHTDVWRELYPTANLTNEKE